MPASIRFALAAPLAASLLLAACGGSTPSSGQSASSAAALAGQSQSGQLPPPIVTQDFIDMAKASSCASTRNQLFVIDHKAVLWDHAGNCADAAYGTTLFGANPTTVLCTSGDTIAGPRTSCASNDDLPLFQTILKNLDKADLGLGNGHTVEALAIQVAPAVDLPFVALDARLNYGVMPHNMVIRDAAAWSAWLKEGSVKPAMPFPEPDFTRQMVIGTAFPYPNNCSLTQIVKVSADERKVTVEYIDQDLISVRSCDSGSALSSTPVNLVALASTTLPVDFVNVNAGRIDFQQIAASEQSAISTARNVVIKDSAAFAALWAEHGGAAGAAPAVDFGKQMVVAIFLGSRGTGCEGIRDVTVWRSGGKINVAHRDNVPGPTVDCMAVMTSPAYLLTLERSDDPVDVVAIPTPNPGQL